MGNSSDWTEVGGGMTESLFESAALDSALKALRDNLLDEGGPKISTMRNYRFAILLYNQRQEFILIADSLAHG